MALNWKSKRRGEDDEDIAGPLTPKRQRRSSEEVWITPRCGADIEEQIKSACEWVHWFNRDVRTILAKSGKKIDAQNSEIAQLKRDNDILRGKLAACEPTRRKAVETEPNQAFATIGQIAKARDEAEKQVARRKTNNTSEILQNSAEIIQND